VEIEEMSATGEHLKPADDGQTPLDQDEAAGLIPSWIATRGDLNVAEEGNVAEGLAWGRKAVGRHDVLTQEFLRSLHQRMFGSVWKWAGLYRSTEKNIGVTPSAISSELKNLFDDVQAWHKFDTYGLDERAARVHHRMTWIHPFPNGNGRCARVFTDLYLAKNGSDEFKWGASLPQDTQRPRYLAAIRAADVHDYGPLLDFLRRDA
jgi:Fic-DOC domain mobile mystery protein B